VHTASNAATKLALYRFNDYTHADHGRTSNNPHPEAKVPNSYRRAWLDSRVARDLCRVSSVCATYFPDAR
jgi:hypothetical protein